MRRVAIIGAGFSGTLVAAHLARIEANGLAVSLIDPSPSHGSGLAYSTSEACHVLNVPASRMSAFADQPSHFLEFALKHVKCDGNSFLPRKLYGAYLQEILGTATRALSIKQIHAEARTIAALDSGFAVRCSDNQTLNVDRVVLALGNLRPEAKDPEWRTFQGMPGYVHDVWSERPWEKHTDQTNVLLIGCGLTMIDVVLAYCAHGYKGKFTAFSRRGLLPRTHQLSAPYKNFIDSASSQFSLGELIQLVRAKVDEAQKAKVPWQAVLDSLRPVTPDLWKGLKLADQRCFLRHLRPYWDAHRHRMAPEVGKQIEGLCKSGRLLLHAGSIERLVAHGSDLHVQFRHRGSGEVTKMKAQRLINCAGSELEIGRSASDLVQNLLSSGLATPDQLDIGLVVSPTYELIGRDGKNSTGMFALGPLLRGSLWETTAVPEIRVQAEIVAENVVQ